MTSAWAEAPADVRVAVVIGNSAYPGQPLANPANDAKAMTEALRKKGFDVIEARDATRVEMLAALVNATTALKGHNGVGMLYYAGHGLQLDWHNYMVPVDGVFSTASQVPAQTVDVQAVLDAFRSAGNRMNIVVLDACRDNPFDTVASGKGLAPMDAPPNTFLAFATSPGNVADDGTEQSGNGLYTQHLLEQIKVPDARIEDVFKRVRWQVRQESEGKQVPWEGTSLEEEFYFSAQGSRPSEEVWEKDFAVEKADWDRISKSTRSEDFYSFLERYPHGFIVEQAQFRLDQLQAPRVQLQQSSDGIRPLAANADRYAVGDVIRMRRVDGYSNKSTDLVLRVTAADHQRVEFNGGEAVWDQMGGTLLNRFGKKDPAIAIAPSNLSVGKQWRTAFTNTAPGHSRPSVNFWESRVVAVEDVVVPAGTFKAYRVESHGEARPQPGPVTFMTRTTWIDPSTMLVVRNDIRFRVAGKLTDNDSEQLVDVVWAPR